MVMKICDIFGQVRSVELVEENGRFRGTVVVDYATENDAKRAFSKIMGTQIGDQLLYVKKITPSAA